MNLSDLRREVDRARAERDALARRLSREEQNVVDARHHLQDAEAAQLLVQQVAASVQETAHKHIAAVVSRCLHAVFGESAYTLRIVFEQRRGKTEADLLFERDGKQVDKDSVGGGVIDVASFALRLACLLLTVPVPRRVLLIDEGFKHLSKKYRPRVRTLLEELSREFGVQVIQVTHSEELVCGEIVEIG